jgi:hypothetical protein
MPQPISLTPLSCCQLGSGGRIYAAGQATDLTSPFLYEMAMGVPGWAGNANITAAARTPRPSGAPGSVVSAILGGFSPRVYTITADGHLYEMAWLGSKWGGGDLTAQLGLRIAASGSPLALGLADQVRPTVYMLGQDYGIYEVSWTGSRWQGGLISDGLKTVTPADGRGPLACLTADASTRSVFYLTGPEDVHVSQLRQSGGAWVYLDVTAAAGGAPPVASALGPLACLRLGVSHSQVYYASADGHVHLLWTGGVQWQDIDLTRAAQAPLAALGGGNLACCAIGGLPRVYYLSEKGHVTEIRCGPDQAWQSRDITEHVGVPPVASLASQLACCALDNGQLRLYYQGADGHVHELAWAA